MLATVLAGRGEINGHALNHDQESNVVWVTDPYGNDSGMLQPNEESCARFLDAMESGRSFGLEP
ncbi:hypothetical protein RCH14_004429 [Massilia sp. MP_M2]|uniref:hypothetical protein n=1 Tax=Massilia sp. MP_M2 TaxID=3071713 RepID=UPI00319EAE33